MVPWLEWIGALYTYIYIYISVFTKYVYYIWLILSVQFIHSPALSVTWSQFYKSQSMIYKEPGDKEGSKHSFNENVTQ